MMNRSRLPVTLPLLVCLAGLGCGLVQNSGTQQPLSGGREKGSPAVVPDKKDGLTQDPAGEMAKAAERFLASLDAEQTSKARFAFKSGKRQFWHYVPDRSIRPDRRRSGLPIGQMTPRQRAFAHALLRSSLSQKAYRQSVTIIALESVLHDLENKNPKRDPKLYYVSIFGEPSPRDTWAWRFEGHHLSINVTLVNGKLISVTPSFYGANPAHVKAGPLEGTRALAAEEDLARRLVQSLSDEQKKQAIIAVKAPRDIITRQKRNVNKDAFLPAQGIRFERLTGDQQAMLRQLVDEYVSKYRPAIIAQIDKRRKIFDGKEMVFAWAGGLQPGQGHYYRVQTPTFLFEYDNTQNKANHVHSVWRHFDGDFGADLLRQHYEAAHSHVDGDDEG